MDWLTFLAICIAVVPIQITIFICLFWFQKKFDKYENIALGIINKYIETKNNIPTYEPEDIEKLSEWYELIRSEVDPHGNQFPRLAIDAQPDVVVTLYRKINRVATHTRKKILIESSMHAIAHTLKDRYRAEGVGPWIENLHGRLGSGFLGTTIDRMASDDWMENNPLISAGLDLVSGAWVYIAQSEKNNKA